MSDAQQDTFAQFEVPDRIRIDKVYDWLSRNRYVSSTPETKSVLEIGYSPGGLPDRLSEHGHISRYAVDINDRTCPDGITFSRHDCNDGLPDFSGTHFDIVFAGEVVEHNVDDESFLKRIHARLTPKGVLALTVPHMFYLVNRLVYPFGKLPYFAYAPFHYHMYSQRTITDVLTRAGFRVRHIRASHVLVSSRRLKRVGRLFEYLGDVFPRFGAHLIVFADKGDTSRTP